MSMLQLNINNETSRLRAVILGIADSNGKTPLLSLKPMILNQSNISLMALIPKRLIW